MRQTRLDSDGKHEQIARRTFVGESVSQAFAGFRIGQSY
jgi:hypothetical protein